MFGIATDQKKPIIITVLGADRVGKSTVIDSLIKFLSDNDNNNNDDDDDVDGVKTLHFSGPQPHHHSPIDQYIAPLQLVMNKPPKVILCDRGFSEVCFYEKFRRGMSISKEWAWYAESYFSSRASKIGVFMIKRDWEWCKPFHLEELREEYSDCSPYFLNSKLKAREAEHYAYYEYMEDYLKNHSLLPSTVLKDNSIKQLREFILGV